MESISERVKSGATRRYFQTLPDLNTSTAYRTAYPSYYHDQSKANRDYNVMPLNVTPERRYFQTLPDSSVSPTNESWSPDPISRPKCPLPIENQEAMYKCYCLDDTTKRCAPPTKIEQWGDTLQVELRHPDAQMPTQGSAESAGYDLYTVEDVYLSPGVVTKIDIQIGLTLPVGTYGRIAARSGNSLKGLLVVGGVIDRDYTGNICVLAYNVNDEDICVTKGARIAQLILEVCRNPIMIKVDYTNVTERGNNGFGSTGN